MKLDKIAHKIVLLCLGLLILTGEASLPTSAIATEPNSPYGQSNLFVVNTNTIGFTDTAILTVSSTPDLNSLPALISLGTMAPNPFNPSITISFNVGQQGSVELSIYDLSGHCLKTLTSQEFEVGQYSRQWNGRNDSGAMMPAGVYLVRIKSSSGTSAKKITLVK